MLKSHAVVRKCLKRQICNYCAAKPDEQPERMSLSVSFPAAPLHPQCTWGLRLHQPPCGEHRVRVCGDSTCPAPSLQSGVAPGAQPLPGGGAARHQCCRHLRAGTHLRRQLPSSLSTMSVVHFFSRVSLCDLSSLA